MNKRLVKLTHKHTKRNEDYFTLLKRYTKQETFYSHPDNDHLVDIMYRLKRFMDIAENSHADRDVQRVRSYCAALRHNKIIDFYDVKDG